MPSSAPCPSGRPGPSSHRAWRSLGALAATALVALLALLAGSPLSLAAPAPAPSATPSATSPVGDAAADYQRHLDNGIKLFDAQNYRGAIAEFDAAYQLVPKASPLINIALCRKALFEYPAAVAALEKALGDHADTLKPEVKQQAEQELRELRAMTAYVTVTVEPSGATLFIDGVERQAADGQGPIALAPGPHTFEARLSGYREAKVALEVATGIKKAVALKLEPNSGRVRVVPKEAIAWVEVDGQTPVQGGYEGLLSPGVHQIRVSKEGEKAETLRIVVAAGKAQVVTQGEDGRLTSDAEAPESVVGNEPTEEQEGPQSGFFFHGGAALLFLTGTPPAYADTKGAAGIGLQLRIGYRVNDWAAFEAGGQLSSVGGAAELYATETEPNEVTKYPDSAYTLRSLRLLGMFRLLAPGDTVVRFVGGLGAGLSIEELVWVFGASGGAAEPPDTVTAYDQSRSALPDSTGGVNAFGQLDLGVEFDIEDVFFGLTIQQIFQGTAGLKDDRERALFSKRFNFLVGPELHVGYGLW